MSSRVRALAILVLVLGLVRAVLFATSQEAPQDRSLLVFDPRAVARIVLAQAGRELILTRDSEADGRWRVASHGGLPALELGPQRLLERLREWRVERVAGSGSGKEVEWGLDEASARRVRLEDASGRTLADLRVGRITGIDRDLAREQGFNVDTSKLGLFVRSADRSEVVVVNEFVTERLQPNPRAWFMRPLVKGEPGTVRALGRRGAGQAFSLRLLPGPPEFVGDARPVDGPKTYSLLRSLFAMVILGPAPGEAPPGAIEVRIEHADGSTQTVRLWSDAERARWFAAVGTLRVEVDARSATAIAGTGADELAQTKILRTGPQDLRRMHWVGASEEIAVARVREDQSWLVTRTGPSRPLATRRHAQAGAEPLTELIAGLTVVRWDRGAEAGLIEPYARVVLVDRRRERFELTLGAVQGGQRAVRVSGAAVPGWLPLELAERLERAFKALAPD